MRQNFALEGKEEAAMTASQIFAAVFIFCRAIIVIPLMKQIQYFDGFLGFKIYSIGIWFISLMWVYQILNMAAKALSTVGLWVIE